MDTYQRVVNQKYEKNSKDNLDMRVMQYKREETQDNTYSAEEKQRVYDSVDRHREEEKHNYTGIPDDLKAQVEEKSGLSLDDVKVMYNSAVPASFQALAIAQGTNVYLGAGQEKHLGHELGHVVQQKQGRVKPTTNINGVPVNDDASLEHEADTIQMKESTKNIKISNILQRKLPEDIASDETLLAETKLYHSTKTLDQVKSILSNIIIGDNPTLQIGSGFYLSPYKPTEPSQYGKYTIEFQLTRNLTGQFVNKLNKWGFFDLGEEIRTKADEDNEYLHTQKGITHGVTDMETQYKITSTGIDALKAITVIDLQTAKEYQINPSDSKDQILLGVDGAFGQQEQFRATILSGLKAFGTSRLKKRQKESV